MHEPDSSSGSPKSKGSRHDDFEPSYLARPDLNNNMPLPNVELEQNFPNSLSFDPAPHISSPNDIIEDVLLSAD